MSKQKCSNGALRTESSESRLHANIDLEYAREKHKDKYSFRAIRKYKNKFSEKLNKVSAKIAGEGGDVDNKIAVLYDLCILKEKSQNKIKSAETQQELNRIFAHIDNAITAAERVEQTAAFKEIKVKRTAALKAIKIVLGGAPELTTESSHIPSSGSPNAFSVTVSPLAGKGHINSIASPPEGDAASTRDRLLKVSDYVIGMLPHSTTRDLFNNGFTYSHIRENIEYNRVPIDSDDYAPDIKDAATIIRSISNASGNCGEAAYLTAFILSIENKSTKNISVVFIDDNRLGDNHGFVSYTDSSGVKWYIDPWNESNPVIKAQDRVKCWKFIYNENKKYNYKRKIKKKDIIWRTIDEDEIALKDLNISFSEIKSTLGHALQEQENGMEVIQKSQLAHKNAAAAALGGAAIAMDNAAKAAVTCFLKETAQGKVTKKKASALRELENMVSNSAESHDLKRIFLQAIRILSHRRWGSPRILGKVPLLNMKCYADNKIIINDIANLLGITDKEISETLYNYGSSRKDPVKGVKTFSEWLRCNKKPSDKDTPDKDTPPVSGGQLEESLEGRNNHGPQL